MNKKNIYKTTGIFIILCIILFVSLKETLAQTASGTPPVTRGTAGRGGSQTQQVASSAKLRADQEIDRRVTSLNNLIAKINAMKKLPSEQKNSLAGKVQAEISSLTALKAKIDADTDAATLRTDKQSIVTSYRVYALFMPQIGLLATSDRVSVLIDKFSDLSAKIELRIQDAQTKGKNVQALQAAFADMKAKIADAKSQIATIQTEVSSLTPEGYPSNKSTLLDARSKLKVVLDDLKTARQDVKTIIQGLRVKTGSTSSPAAATPATSTSSATRL